jgi:SanA protein
MMNTVVLVGDYLTIVLLMFFSGLGIPYHDPTTTMPWLLGFWINTLPYLLIWSLIGHTLNGSPYSIRWKRLLLRWSVTAVVSGTINYLIVRMILPGLYSQIARPGFPITKIAFTILLGWVALTLWRLTYQLFRRLSESDKYMLLRRALIYAGLVFCLIVVVGIGLQLYLNLHYSGSIVTRNETPARDLGIVFGAGVSGDGVPSGPLIERVSTAAHLYNEGVLAKLLLSSGFSYGHSEAEIMMEVALELGVPGEAMVIDTNGINTIQTCMNAKTLMEDKNSIALITHEYHLPRAMMICDLLGIESIGVIAEQNYVPPNVLFFRRMREFFASMYAYLLLK